MTNLLKETIAALFNAAQSWEDVVFIGSRDGEFGCTVEEFQSLADLEYDPGYGGAEIAGDLVIVFRDHSWLERGEYDGSEWWNFMETPRTPDTWTTLKFLQHRGF